MNMNFKIVLTIIVASSVLGLIINFISPKGIPLIVEEKSLSWANEEINIDANGEETILKEPPAIHLEQAKNLYERNALFIDAREKEEYEVSHIKGAINIPFYSFDEYKNQLKNIEKSRIIITYCGGTDCDLSILLGNQLFELGYKNTFIFFGGWNDWLKAKYPVNP
jgi:rhodanese-related sulfurtransferase